jgi:glutaredoxin
MQAVVYTKQNCQWCDRVKYLLNHLKIEYLEYEYEKDFTKSQFYNEFGEGATFPQVSIGTIHIGGCKETLHYLQEQELL